MYESRENHEEIMKMENMADYGSSWMTKTRMPVSRRHTHTAERLSHRGWLKSINTMEIATSKKTDHSKKNKNLATESSNFDISNLPNDILEHIVSFLSSREAVRVSVLSKPWKHLWKYVHVLRISETVEECNRFLGNFLLKRNDNPINVCDIEMTDLETMEMHDVVDMWIFHAITHCHVHELRVIVRIEGDFLWLKDKTLISKNLKRVELDKVNLEAKTIDLSSCPALEEIVLLYCTIQAKNFKSRSLKRLIAEACDFAGADTRTHISAPSMVFLKLIDIWNCTPVLEDMPSLEVAYIRLGNDCTDYCQYNKFWGCDNEYCGFGCTDSEKYDNILLKGLSNATHLELLNEPGMFIFQRDLRKCPKFRNLRTLILNGCFMVPNPDGLVCIIKNSPLLEELNLLLLEDPKQVVESNGDHNEKENILLMENLKEVKVTCQRKYLWIENIISTLIAFGISAEKIIVEEKLMYLDAI